MGLFLWLEIVRREPVRSPAARAVLALPCADQSYYLAGSYWIVFKLLFANRRLSGNIVARYLMAQPKGVLTS